MNQVKHFFYSELVIDMKEQIINHYLKQTNKGIYF